jgi:hypothetical protein
MEIIKRKILLEDIISRKGDGTYGTITGDSFYVKIMLTQNYDDMGVFTNFGINNDALLEPELHTPYEVITGDDINVRYVNDSVTDYIVPTSKLSGLTEDRLEDVKSYNINNVYQEGLDIQSEAYINYTGFSVDGKTRVTSVGEPLEYVVDANDDANIGTMNQNDGFYLQTFSGQSRTVNVGGNNKKIPLTNIFYNRQGWNEANTGHSGLTKEEYLFGITSEPEVFSDVFIERGVVSVKERHLKLSEVKSLDDLTNYGNGFFNVKK